MACAKRVVTAIATLNLIGLAVGPTPVQAATAKASPPASAPAAPKTPATPAPPAAIVTLPLELKDPYTAYSLGMLPFASTVAARYVGTRRLSWRIDETLEGAATRQALMDWGLLVAGLGTIGLSTGSPYGIQSQVAFVGATALIAIPLSHALLYAPFWGDQAVQLNRTEMLRHGFPVEDERPLVPVAD